METVNEHTLYKTGDTDAPEQILRSLIEDAVANHKSPEGYIKLCLKYFNDGTLARASLLSAGAPIPMILHCPKCNVQHIDAPDGRKEGWNNPPHRSHLCHACGHIWRPADVATEGVATIKTRGSKDSAGAPVNAEPGAWITPQVAQNLDRQYRDGFTAGWNAGVAGDDELLAAVQNRVGKREDYEAASAPVSAELQLRIDQVAMITQTLANDIRKYNRRNEPK